MRSTTSTHPWFKAVASMTPAEKRSRDKETVRWSDKRDKRKASETPDEHLTLHCVSQKPHASHVDGMDKAPPLGDHRFRIAGLHAAPSRGQNRGRAVFLNAITGKMAEATG